MSLYEENLIKLITISYHKAQYKYLFTTHSTSEGRKWLEQKASNTQMFARGGHISKHFCFHFQFPFLFPFLFPFHFQFLLFYIPTSNWRYGKAGNKNEIKTKNRNWKQNWEQKHTPITGAMFSSWIHE